MAFGLLRHFVSCTHRRTAHSRGRTGLRPRLESLEQRLALTAGALDPTFGLGGKVLTDFTVPADFPGSDFGRQVAIEQADGKLVVAGSSNFVFGTDEVALARYNPDGSLDTTFGDEGRVRDSFPTLGSVTGMSLQGDGKIVVAGYASGIAGGDFFLARYNTDGARDTTFGGDGWVTSDLGGDELGESVAIGPNGKIVVAGYSSNDITGADFAVARYNSDGSLDTSFDGDGKVTTDFGFDSDQAFSVAVQANGKIVAAGTTFRDGGADFALARYNRDGSLDTSFSGDGLLTTDFDSFDDLANSVAVQADGKIVAAGHSNQFTTTYDFALARYNPDGTPDLGFGVGGKVTTDFGASDFAQSVAVQRDGKIVAAGYTDSGDFAVARYTRTGELDDNFSGDGRATADFGGIDDVASSVSVQANGKIVAAGTSYQGEATSFDFAVARFDASGNLDSAFDGDGLVTTNFPVLFVSNADAARQIAVQQSDGKLVVAGPSTVLFTANAVALARYNPDGSLDPSFGTNGRVEDLFAATPEITSLALTPDGEILVAGIGIGDFSRDFFLARYTSGGVLDTSFGDGGFVLTDFGGNDDLAARVALQSDGKIVVGGASAADFFNYDFAVARYTRDGALDASFGVGGLATADFGSTPDIAFGLVVQPDDKLVVAGSSSQTDSASDFALARFNRDGDLDAGFGVGGLVLTDFNSSFDIASDAAIQADGKIVAVGVTSPDGLTDGDFALARYNGNGDLDTSFGGDGLVTTDFNGPDDWAFSVAVQPDGKLLAAGYSFQGAATGYDFALARYSSSGELDLGFDRDGRVTTDFGGTTDVAQSVAVQSDGKIVVAGVSQQGTRDNDFALARYEGLFSGAAIETDATDPTKTQLVVGGTSGDDTIEIQKVNKTGAVEVKLNGKSLGTFNPTGRIVVYGYAGNDNIQVSGGGDHAAWLYGGAGNDLLSGGDASDVLLGGDGYDLLIGGNGRDLLIGGSDNDLIAGSADDDILISGTTDHDANEAALKQIMDEWTRTSVSFATRVSHLKGPLGGGSAGGINGASFLNEQTVHDDGAIDVLTGASGNDWFFFNKDGDGDRRKKDIVADMSTSEATFAQDIDSNMP